MKIEYIKPLAEYINLYSEETITDVMPLAENDGTNLGETSTNLGVGEEEIPDDWT